MTDLLFLTKENAKRFLFESRGQPLLAMLMFVQQTSLLLCNRHIKYTTALFEQEGA